MIRNDCFTGFTFNGIHSSTLGIVRIIESNRIPVKLTPSITDKTVDIPGADLTEFFSSNYKQLELNIPIAFDKLSEEQFRRLKQFYNTRNPYPLILDDNPYKVYKAIGRGAPQIRYVAFEQDKVRWYGGEAVLNFICLAPFAQSRYQFRDSYERANIVEWQDIVNEMTITQKDLGATDPTDNGVLIRNIDESETDNGEYIYEDSFDWLENTDEWLDASDIQSSSGYNEPFERDGAVIIKVYNSGDKPMPISLYLKFIDDEIPATDIILDNKILHLARVTKKKYTTILNDAPDYFIHINSKENSVKGVDYFYNDTERNYIAQITGNFLLAPEGDSEIIFSNADFLPYIEKVKYGFEYY